MKPILLALLLCLPAAGQDPASPSILALDAEEPDVSGNGMDGGMLIRELVRQALLLAAREELGLATRDRALRETFPAAARPLAIQTTALVGKSLRIRVSRAEADARRPVWEHALTLPPGNSIDYLALVRGCEELSRKDCVEAIRKAGFEGKANVTGPRGRASDALERRLAGMNFFDQFAAARELHQTFRSEGESPARLGALVRAYSHLGQLSEGLWNASSKVFKARALLYAERLAVRHPDLPASLWHRAYARTLAGLHAAALEDLAAAGRKAGEAVLPEWVPWIDAVCRYDTPAISVARADYHAGLLRYLAFMTQHGCGSAIVERRRILEAAEANPDCTRLFDALCQLGGISNLHEATTTGPEIFARNLYVRVLEIPGLPEATRKISLATDPVEPARRAALWKSLLLSEGPGEPSFSLLGRFLEETSFAQTVRRGDFMKFKWGVEVDEYLAEAAPLVADHPYAALVRSYALDARRQAADYAALFRGLNLVDADDSFLPAINATWNLDPKGSLQGKKAWSLVSLHRDGLAGDLGNSIRFTPAKEVEARKGLARSLLQVSPHSPHAIAVLIDSDWDAVSARAGDWEKTLGHHPQVVRALGQRYKALKRHEDAERCLKRATEIAPGLGVFRALAGLYRDQGKIDLWKETLESFLRTEDVGLDHANVRVEIARYHMGRKEWDKAAPYAEQAAESWAGWAMGCAVECHEGSGNLERAGLWQQRLSERYPSSGHEWYFWVRRTGHGDEEAARALAEKRVRELSARATADDHEMIGIFHILAGNRKDALASFGKAQESKAGGWNAFHAALLARELGDDAARTAALDRAAASAASVRKEGKKLPPTLQLAELVRDAWSKGTRLESAAVEAALKEAEPDEFANAAYFAGRYYALEGDAPAARKHYERSVGTGRTGKWNLMLSADALRSLKRF